MSIDILDLIKAAVDNKASDLHISVGLPATCRVNGRLLPLNDYILKSEDTESMAKDILNDQQFDLLEKNGEVDISFSAHGQYRSRLNIFRQKGCYSMSFRLISLDIQSFEELGLPDVLSDFCLQNRGLVLVTGLTGTGKSTTLAAMIDWINTNRDCHIVTLEEPIEYVHNHKKSIVSQREIGQDCLSYSNALRAVLRQDPDVILIGEMRDLESISIALTAAETGHLVLSTLHTIGSSKTIDRIIDVFPSHQQQQIRTQLSMVLLGVVSQQLIPSADGSGRVAAAEVMTVNSAIRNLIRENKIHQIANVIHTNSKIGMKTMDNSILELYSKGKISAESALNYSIDSDYMKKMLSHK